MGIAADGSVYEAAVKKLFPQGEYWDRQFADPESDVSLFCKAKVFELTRFRSRMAALLGESNPATARETLEDWERVLLGSIPDGLDVSQRRTFLLSKQNETFSRSRFHDIAGVFGFSITDIRFPYRPAFFGFSRFGVDRVATPAAWQVIVLRVLTHGGDGQTAAFEERLNSELLANYITHFEYNGGKQ
jgi:uncharacterized protein YmfQ (DUF2313 family)